MTLAAPRRTVLVTGAAHNLGLAIARQFAAEGAHVVTHARTRDDAEAAAAAIAASGATADPVWFDLAEPAAIERGFAELDDRGTVVDVLVLNAAHLGLSEEGTIDQTFDFFDEVMAVNVSGAYRCSVLVARRLIAEGRRGAIVVISSLAGERAIHGRLAYNTSKAAVDGLVRSLAIDLAPDGIRVNGIAPGYVWSDRWEGISAAEAAARRSLIPAGVETTQGEIARLAVFLASDASPTLTGERIVIDGGLSAQQSPSSAGEVARAS